MTLSFADVRFPEDIAYGSSGGPQFATDVIVSYGGHEQRNSNWAQARSRYNVAHGVKTQGQLDALIAFFRARKGRAQGFRFKDWTDCAATGQLLGTGDGVRTAFALLKNYTSGGDTHSRTITRPVAGTVSVAINGVTQVGGYTCPPSTGIVTFSNPPAVGASVTASFEFDVPVRFDTDRLSARLDGYGSFSWLDIPLVEVRG